MNIITNLKQSFYECLSTCRVSVFLLTMQRYDCFRTQPRFFIGFSQKYKLLLT
jgi:hypothetical protein